MKAVKRIVSTSFWEDEKVVEKFSPEDKYFYLYLLTNPHTTQLGVYKLVPKTAAFELGYSKEAVFVLLERFEKKYDLIRFSNETSEVAIKNYLCYSIVKGGKPVMDCLLKEESDIKDKSLLVYIYNNINSKDNLNNTVKEFLNHIEKYIKNTINDNDNERYVNESLTNRTTNRTTNRESGLNPPIIGDQEQLCFEDEEENSNVTDDVDPSISYSLSFNNLKNFKVLLDGNNYGNSEYIKSNDLLFESISDWMSYKDERTPKKSNHYTEKGMKSLLTEIVNHAKEYGADAVVKTINHTMANQWQGIFWDWMERKFTRAEKSNVDQQYELFQDV